MDLNRECFRLKSSGTFPLLALMLEVKPFFIKLTFMPDGTNTLLKNTKDIQSGNMEYRDFNKRG